MKCTSPAGYLFTLLLRDYFKLQKILLLLLVNKSEKPLFHAIAMRVPRE